MHITHTVRKRFLLFLGIPLSIVVGISILFLGYTIIKDLKNYNTSIRTIADSIGKIASISATPSPTLLETPPSPNSKTGTTTGPLINCTGPDGVTFKTTQIECDNLNTFWKNPDAYKDISTDGWDRKLSSNHTTIMSLPADDHMSTSDELFEAINTYRKAQAISPVSKNDTICRIAQSRADEVYKLGKLDGHAGFSAYVQNQQEFSYMAEVMYGGSQNQSGVHIVEYGWDRSLTGHRQAIQDATMTHGCGGVAGYFAVFVFGRK